MPSVIYASSANTVEAPTYKQLNDTMLLQREVLKNTIADTIDIAPFVSMLMLMSKGRTSRSKKPEWLVGDSEAVRTTLASADVRLNSTTKGDPTQDTITLTMTTVPTRSLIYMHDVVHGLRAIVRYNGQGVAGTVVYASGTGTWHYSSDTVVYIMPTSMYFDGEAGLGVNYGGLFYNNAMMRIRESVERGPHTESDSMYMKRDLAEIARIKYIAIQKQLEQFLMLSNTKAIAETGFERDGIAGGLDYFLLPYVTTGMADILGVTDVSSNESATTVSRGTGVRGWTKLISGDTIDFDTCEDIMADARVYGASPTRDLFAPPAVIAKFLKMARNNVSLTKDRWSFPAFPDIVLEAPMIETGFGNIRLHTDYTMAGVYKKVLSGSNYITDVNWGVLLDLAQFDWITHDVPGKGIQNLSLKPVKLEENNNTVEKAEWDGTGTLACFEPRANGTIAFGTIV